MIYSAMIGKTYVFWSRVYTEAAYKSRSLDSVDSKSWIFQVVLPTSYAQPFVAEGRESGAKHGAPKENLPITVANKILTCFK